MSYKGFADFRSDTVTRPTEEMKQAMMNAELGDDVLGDDPTVIALENLAAERLGKEAALFVPSGTMGNTIAMKLGAGEGKWVIMEEKCHIFNFEAGNVSRIAGSLPHILPSERGRIPLHLIEGCIHSALSEHMPQTRAIALENTHNVWGGTVLTCEYMKLVSELAVRHSLHRHLDGARVFNAAVALGVDVADISCYFDTVMVCLSKGLSAPIGSLLAGEKHFIKEARFVRKSLGGGMRQVGMLAAAGIYALNHMVTRLAQDHERAKRLAAGTAQFKELDVLPEDVETNIVKIEIKSMDAFSFLEKLGEHKILALPLTSSSVRFVTHKDIDDHDVERAITCIGKVLESELG